MHKFNFSQEVLRAGVSVIGFQAGSNKFASQNGMVIGVRHINDIKCDDISEAGKSTINLQYGYHAGANQSRMNFGKNRSVVTHTH